jgi:hypothetical protein
MYWPDFSFVLVYLQMNKCIVQSNVVSRDWYLVHQWCAIRILRNFLGPLRIDFEVYLDHAMMLDVEHL